MTKSGCEKKKVNDRSFEALEEMASDPVQKLFTVRSRGRPKTEPAEEQSKTERRKEFGAILKRLRKSKGLTLNAAADRAGLTSGRKLSQYEQTCYPSGWVIQALAPVYEISAARLARLAMKSRDPEMFNALFSDLDDFDPSGDLDEIVKNQGDES